MTMRDYILHRDRSQEHPDLYTTAEEIERRALAAGNNPQAGRKSALITEDRCKHGGCFT